MKCRRDEARQMERNNDMKISLLVLIAVVADVALASINLF